MQLKIMALITFALILTASHAQAADDEEGRLGYIVTYRHKVITNGVFTWNKALHSAITRKLRPQAAAASRQYGAFPVSFFAELSEAELRSLRASPEVEAIFVNREAPFNGTYSSYLENSTSTALDGLSALRGTGATIAVFDTGLDYTHPEFGTCTQPGSSGCHVVASIDAAPNDNVLDDASTHGTHTALIALRSAPGATLVSIDVAGSNGSASTSSTLSALNWVINNASTYNIQAINMSYGASLYANSVNCATRQGPYHTAYATLRSMGITIVAAAGNQGEQKLSEEACEANAFPVGAIWWTDYVGGGSKLWTANEGLINCSDFQPTAFMVPCWSNSHDWLSLVAPGVAIPGFGAETGNGTSGSAPQVAATAALLSTVLEPPAGTNRVEFIESSLQSSRHTTTDHFGHHAAALDVVNASVTAMSTTYARLQTILSAIYSPALFGKISDQYLMSLINSAKNGASDQALLGQGIAPLISALGP